MLMHMQMQTAGNKHATRLMINGMYPSALSSCGLLLLLWMALLWHLAWYYSLWQNVCVSAMLRSMISQTTTTDKPAVKHTTLKWRKRDTTSNSEQHTHDVTSHTISCHPKPSHGGGWKREMDAHDTAPHHTLHHARSFDALR